MSAYFLKHHLFFKFFHKFRTSFNFKITHILITFSLDPISRENNQNDRINPTFTSDS